jgi:hypothetical protein
MGRCQEPRLISSLRRSIEIVLWWGLHLDKILFASLYMQVPDKPSWARTFDEIGDDAWMWDEFRGTWMLALRTADGKSDLNSIRSQKTEAFGWTDFASEEIRDYFQKHVFSWMGPRTRIMVLKTLPGMANKEHVDCAPDNLNSRQHKFRLIVSGKTDSLYFLTAQGNIPAPRTEYPFIMDGRWPHGMVNSSDEIKYTICAGSPWTGSDAYPAFEQVLYKSDYTAAALESRFWHPKYGHAESEAGA